MASLPVAIKGDQGAAIFEAQLLAVPVHQEILMRRLEPVRPEATPFIRECRSRLRLLDRARSDRGIGGNPQVISSAKLVQIRAQRAGQKARNASHDRKPGTILGIAQHTYDDMHRVLFEDGQLELVALGKTGRLKWQR